MLPLNQCAHRLSFLKRTLKKELRDKGVNPAWPAANSNLHYKTKGEILFSVIPIRLALNYFLLHSRVYSLWYLTVLFNMWHSMVYSLWYLSVLFNMVHSRVYSLWYLTVLFNIVHSRVYSLWYLTVLFYMKCTYPLQTLSIKYLFEPHTHVLALQVLQKTINGFSKRGLLAESEALLSDGKIFRGHPSCSWGSENMGRPAPLSPALRKSHRGRANQTPRFTFPSHAVHPKVFHSQKVGLPPDLTIIVNIKSQVPFISQLLVLKRVGTTVCTICLVYCIVYLVYLAYL